MLEIIHKYGRIPYSLHVYTNRRPARSRASIILLHGIGNSSAAWDEVIHQLPPDVHIISIDLLGHGSSPRPEWSRYDAKTQARALMHTVMRLGLRRQPILVGHSLGALVAIEFAKRYPLLVRSLVLCSPPLYIDQNSHGRIPNRDKMLKNIYAHIQRHPSQFTTIVKAASKIRLLPQTFKVDESNVAIYMAALEASIVNQTAFMDALRLSKPMTIIHGKFDPVVIKPNLELLVNGSQTRSLVTVPAGHEITGPYVTTIADTIKKLLPKS